MTRNTQASRMCSREGTFRCHFRNKLFSAVKLPRQDSRESIIANNHIVTDIQGKSAPVNSLSAPITYQP
ncbi:uncharacterized protein EAE98_000070 [Botrytis deweyae]|uniref:Uncharacterized protein n=1 Tax=Botrytis deweyae TaxID=2478750 RepID=A0ABQ7J1M0_9HELO|nr:uncharacterized protein EAE98_000070 [Botrytis deweyae]KAF7939943.1 hypothetical protein EAE98_000070 [Botrytis deweyae]